MSTPRHRHATGDPPPGGMPTSDPRYRGGSTSDTPVSDTPIYDRLRYELTNRRGPWSESPPHRHVAAPSLPAPVPADTSEALKQALGDVVAGRRTVDGGHVSGELVRGGSPGGSLPPEGQVPPGVPAGATQGPQGPQKRVPGRHMHPAIKRHHLPAPDAGQPAGRAPASESQRLPVPDVRQASEPSATHDWFEDPDLPQEPERRQAVCGGGGW